MRIAKIALLGMVLGAGAARAEEGIEFAEGLAPAPPLSPEQLREGAEKDLDARMERLLALARRAFEARDYDASRRLAYAACQLRPGSGDAQELHAMSIRYGRRLRAVRPGSEGRVARSTEGVDQALARLSGDRTVRWAQVEGSDGPGEEAVVRAEAKPEWQAKIEAKMAEKSTVEFKETQFSEVKEYFEAFLGCPMVVDRRLRDRVMALPVSFKAKDMPFEQVLSWVVENDLGLRWIPADGALYVSDSDGICEKAGVTLAYEVDDLLYESQMPDFAGPSLDLRDSGAPGDVMGLQFDASRQGPAPPRRGLTGERLVKILERSVEPGTWKEGEK